MDSQQCVLIESQQGYKFLIKHHKWSDLMWTQRAQHKKSRARTHRSRNPHRIQSRIINISSRFPNILVQSSRELAILIVQQIQSSSCTITNTHTISKRITTTNQIQTRTIPETHRIQSSSHTRIMRNQITHIQIHIIQCVHTHIQIRIRVTVYKLAQKSYKIQKCENSCII